MSANAIVLLVCGVSGALLTAGGLVARAVRTWAGEVGGLRSEIADYRLEMEQARGADRLEVREVMGAELRQHVAECPAREPTGVEVVP
jgi:hypothetical protein